MLSMLIPIYSLTKEASEPDNSRSSTRAHARKFATKYAHARTRGQTVCVPVHGNVLEPFFRNGDVLIVLAGCVSPAAFGLCLFEVGEDLCLRGEPEEFVGAIVGANRGVPNFGETTKPHIYVDACEAQGIYPVIVRNRGWSAGVLYEIHSGTRPVAFGPVPPSDDVLTEYLKRTHRIVFGADLLSHPFMPRAVSNEIGSRPLSIGSWLREEATALLHRVFHKEKRECA